MITSYVSRLSKITIAHHTGYKTSIFPCDLQIVPLLRTKYYKNSFSHCGAILWNSPPCDLREAFPQVAFPEAV